MSCSSCVSSLSGFGQDETLDVSPELVSGMKSSLGLLIGVPVAASVVGAAGGAYAWKEHRVIGGLLGWLGGGLVGGAIGSVLAKNKLEQAVLPELENLAAMAEQQGGGGISMTAPDGTLMPGIATNTAGPLRTKSPVALPIVSKLLGMSPESVVSKVVSAAVTPSTMGESHLIAPKTAIPTLPMAPRLTLTKVASPLPTITATNKVAIPTFKTSTSTPAADPSSSSTFVPAGSTMGTLRI